MIREKIKFAGRYAKLHGQTEARLLAVLPLKVDDDTPQELLDYDTVYDGGRYPLPHGDYVQLIFIGNLRIPFCTIRAKTNSRGVDKEAYYNSKVGEVFEIIVEE